MLLILSYKEMSSHQMDLSPMRAWGVKSRMCPPYPQRDRKRRLNGAVCRNHRIKRVVPCRCWDGHVKEPCEMSMAWEPDRRYNFFSPPAHLCAVTYMTEISLHVTLNNQSNPIQSKGFRAYLFLRFSLDRGVYYLDQELM